MKIVFFSGAGISAESGIKTFRDSDGLWENHSVEEVATIQGWKKNRELVLEFYNQRRQQLKTVKPNKAHKEIANFKSENLELDIKNITQNVDDLFERCGLKDVLHLHGELTRAKASMSSTENSSIFIGYNDIKLGDKHEDGSQMRPDIVWFGEAVPNMYTATQMCKDVDILCVIGTSLNVYPAASIAENIDENCLLIVVDPKADELSIDHLKTIKIKEGAVKGVKIAIEKINSYINENRK